MLSRKVRIEASARAHLGLIALHAGGERRYGGVGFMLRRPSVTITAFRGVATTIEDRRSVPFGSDELRDLDRALRATQEDLGSDAGWTIRIEGDLRSHMGLGSGTAIRMAAIEALCHVLGDPLDAPQLRLRSGRGGVSGIGVHGYFEGGFQFDVGTRAVDSPFRPSSVLAPTSSPTRLCQLAMPNWPIAVVVPTRIGPVDRGVERALFERTLPLSRDETMRTLETAVMDVAASVAEVDLDGFSRGLRRMQDSVWKRAERALHGAELLEIEQELYSMGASAVALSSMGPSLIAVGPMDFHNRLPGSLLGRAEIIATRADDRGRRILL